jgi:hypothetical protein
MRFDNLLFYSTNTFLAHYINEKYYNGVHFVWCSPVFDPTAFERIDVRSKIGITSSPADIYKRLKEDISRDQKHSLHIREARTNLKRAVLIKQKELKFTKTTQRIIIEEIDDAPYDHFKPLIYLIPSKEVKKRIIEVPIMDKATTLGKEYQIHDLRKKEFEIIDNI